MNEQQDLRRECLYWFWQFDYGLSLGRSWDCKLELQREIPVKCVDWKIIGIEEISEMLWLRPVRKEYRARRKERWMRTEGGRGRKRSRTYISKLFSPSFLLLLLILPFLLLFLLLLLLLFLPQGIYDSVKCHRDISKRKYRGFHMGYLEAIDMRYL